MIVLGRRFGIVGLCVAVLPLLSSEARAAKLPFAFAPPVAENPQRTQDKRAALEAKLTSFALPASLTTLQSGQATLWFFPEMTAAFQRAGTSASSPPMAWPGGTPALCAKHAAFNVPANLLAPGASDTCRTSEATLRQQLAASRVCTDVEQPERYVLSAPPAVVDDTTTGSIEALIGLAGEALHHYPVQDGLLPPDWVPNLRSVLWKIRRSAIASQSAAARASYQQALATLASASSCFNAPEAATLKSAVNALDAELVAAEAHVGAVNVAGKAKADQELVCLAARSRERRETLPFPSLTTAERKFVAFWLGGIYWRMRGGGLIPLGSTQKARTYFLERPFRRIGNLAGGAVGEETGFRIYLNIFAGWGQWADMGTTAGQQDFYEDLVQMTDRGRQQVADPATAASGVPIPIPIPNVTPPVQFLADQGYDTTALMTGGLDMGPCYAYALNPLKDFRYADVAMAPYGGALIEYFTALGEFCAGASIGLGMAETLLEGTPNGAPPADLCKGKQCGDDGCSGSCGTCSAGTTCSGGACVACTPSCAGRACGDDGCGGSCGTCAGGGPDGGPGPAAGASPSDTASGGCGCRTTGSMGGAALLLVPVGVGFVALLRRRRASRDGTGTS